jgi:hypothetical protein
MAEIMSNNVKKKEMVNISIDTSILNVVQYDYEGKDLNFEGGEKFLSLPDEVVSELSKFNRIRYFVAKQERDLEVKAGKDDEWKHKIEITEQYASPTDRMKVKNPDPNMEYYLASPAKMHKHASQGYEVVPASAKASIGLSGENKLGTLGQTELVLMQTTKENKARIEKQKKELKEWRMGNINAAAEQAAADGNIALVRDED